jgi:hypothetical protein
MNLSLAGGHADAFRAAARHFRIMDGQRAAVAGMTRSLNVNVA